MEPQMKLIIGSLFVLALPFAVARADHRHIQPPQAAFDACAKSNAGDACSIAIHDHAISGVCVQAPDRAALVCRPDHPPGPPPEAIEACRGRNAGDACSITHGDLTIAGTCASCGQGDGGLACHPEHAPPPP